MMDSRCSGTDAFDPPALLRNTHVQSLLSSSVLRRIAFRRRGSALEHASVEHILNCGGGVRLQGFYSAQTRRPSARALVVLLHGWEGSAQSNYILHTGARLLDEGCDVFRLNFRDHGGTQHLNGDLFHSCRIDEVVGAVAEVARLFGARVLIVGGFSLGGNFALRVALRAPAASLALAWTFAVCPVISPHASLASIEAAPWFYEFYFMHKWRASLRRKQALFPQRELFTRAELRGGLRGLTRNLVLRHTSFGTLENYLDGYSIAGDRLAGLSVPATILAAQDDPVIPIADFASLELAPATELTIVPHGGHCGFIRNFALHSWAEDFILARMQQRLEI